MPIQLNSDVARPESADDLDHIAWIAQHLDLGGPFDALEAQLDEALKYESFHELMDRAGDCLSIDVTNLLPPLREKIDRFTLAVALATFRP
jgi:hypothetical protein